MAPDKRKSPEKIDDITALLMAIGLSIPADCNEDGNMDDWLNDPVRNAR
jgi:hypothetical protein